MAIGPLTLGPKPREMTTPSLSPSSASSSVP